VRGWRPPVGDGSRHQASNLLVHPVLRSDDAHAAAAARRLSVVLLEAATRTCGDRLNLSRAQRTREREEICAGPSAHRLHECSRQPFGRCASPNRSDGHRVVDPLTPAHAMRLRTRTCSTVPTMEHDGMRRGCSRSSGPTSCYSAQDAPGVSVASSVMRNLGFKRDAALRHGTDSHAGA